MSFLNKQGLEKLWEKTEERIEAMGGGSGGGLPTGGTPYQMLVTDAEGNTVWEDRQLYKRESIVLPETTLTEDAFIADDNSWYITTPLPEKPIAGNTYTVSWNGVDYERVAQAITSEGIGTFVAIGNMASVTGEDDGTPFVCMVAPAEMEAQGVYFAVMPADGSTTVTISIKGMVYNKLDYAFMPDGYPRVEHKNGELLPETEFQLAQNSIFYTETPLFGNLIPGKTYIVNWNGVDHEVTATEINDTENDFYLVALGNTEAFAAGTETDDPFCLFDPTGTMYQQIVPTAKVFAAVYDGSSAVTVKITGEMDVVTEMDSRFITGTVGKLTSGFISVANAYEADHGWLVCNVGDEGMPLWGAVKFWDYFENSLPMPPPTDGFITKRNGNYTSVSDAFGFTEGAGELNAVFLRSPAGERFKITVDDSGNVSTSEDGDNIKTAVMTTPVTTSDNGKFLRVVDGAWAAVALPNAEEASF